MAVILRYFTELALGPIASQWFKTDIVSATEMSKEFRYRMMYDDISRDYCVILRYLHLKAKILLILPDNLVRVR